MNASAGLLVLDPGWFTTVQDRGRFGFRDRGVTTGGTFNKRSAAIANALLGNDPSAAVLEMTLHGGAYLALQTIALALIGAKATRRDVQGRESSILDGSSFTLFAGERLQIILSEPVVRAYIGVLGGWQTEQILGSRSSEIPLSKNDQIACFAGHIPTHRLDFDHFRSFMKDSEPISIILGPDADRFAPSSLGPDVIFYVEDRSNRVGVRLGGPTSSVELDPDRLSTPVAPGAIQIAGDRPMILGVACGTMGGYSHVAHVISADLDRIAQVRPGQKLSFRWVDLAEARRLDLESRVRLANDVQRIRTMIGDAGHVGRTRVDD